MTFPFPMDMMKAMQAWGEKLERVRLSMWAAIGCDETQAGELRDRVLREAFHVGQVTRMSTGDAFDLMTKAITQVAQGGATLAELMEFTTSGRLRLLCGDSSGTKQ